MFDVQSGGRVQISGLTVQRGNPGQRTDAGSPDGGGIRTRGALTVDLVVVRENFTSSNGGGIRAETGGSLIVRRSTIRDNLTGQDGGGISSGTTGSVMLDSVTIVGNRAGRGGGGVDTDHGSLSIVNSTITGNHAASQGGGIVHDGGQLTLRHTTVAFNEAQIRGGIDQNTSNPSFFRANILAHNVGGDCGFYRFASVTSLGSNLVSDGSCRFTAAGDQPAADPRLGPLANNGGPTETHALLDGSPALDAVQEPCTSDGTAGGQPIAVDQRGQPRPSGQRCDIGAFERQSGVLQFGAASFVVSEAGPAASIAVTRAGGTEGAVGATVTAGGGTASAGLDYTGTAFAVSFADGQAATTVNIPIANDLLDEPDETVNLTLGAPTGGATLGALTAAVLTIQDDDTTPGLSISDAAVAEGDVGTTTLTFIVTLSPPNPGPVTVPFSLGNQTATGGAACTAGVDFVNAGGTVTFNPFDTSEPVAVTVCSDALLEGSETFLVDLGTPTGGATIADGRGVGTITDDNAAGSLSFSTASVQVPEIAGSATLTVQRSGGAGPNATSGDLRLRRPERQRPPERLANTTNAGPSSRAPSAPVTVNFATADQTAHAGQDYTAVAGTLTFGVGETTKTIVIPILNDSLPGRPGDVHRHALQPDRWGDPRTAVGRGGHHRGHVARRGGRSRRRLG